MTFKFTGELVLYVEKEVEAGTVEEAREMLENDVNVAMYSNGEVGLDDDEIEITGSTDWIDWDSDPEMEE